MNFGHGAIVSAFVVTTLILLGLGLYSKWSPRTKTGAIVLVTLAYLLVYFALPRILGWPTDRQVPRRFNLIAVYIQDPDEQTGEAGSVFFWAGDLAPGADPRPRAYRMPFKALFKSVFQEAQGKLRQNIPQEGEIELDDEPKGAPLDWTRMGQKSVKLKFKDAMVNLPPAKGTPN
ncbi:MAG: hypothetical protein EXR86_02850 [Gammaproteobacteria bacterium]|nr:hypothetical protein [Gammaproteobacteria bacterium]